MTTPWRAVCNILVNTALLVLGLVLAAVPLALWVVWSETLFYAIIAVFCVALPLYVVLHRFEAPVANTRPPYRQPTIAPAFIDEVQRLMPLVYHHYRPGAARFHRAMAKARALMRQNGD